MDTLRCLGWSLALCRAISPGHSAPRWLTEEQATQIGTVMAAHPTGVAGGMSNRNGISAPNGSDAHLRGQGPRAEAEAARRLPHVSRAVRAA